MRVNMVILGDGYVVEDFGEGGKWEVDAERLVSDFFNQPPFKSLRSLFNVFLVEVISQECGADDSPQTDSKRTALNCTYGQRDLAHLLVCKDKGAALTAAANAPAVDILIVIVNDSRLGGSGGKFDNVPAVVCSYRARAFLTIHELGHAFAGLADEYVDAKTSDKYPLPTNRDLAAPNVTLAALVDTSSKEALIRTLKWGHFLERPNADKAFGTGYVEGGYYRSSGVYRPAQTCLMASNWHSGRFCFVCKEEMTKAIYKAAGRGAGGGVFPEGLPYMKGALRRARYFYGLGLFGETIKGIDQLKKKSNLTPDQLEDIKKLRDGIATTLRGSLEKLDSFLKAGNAAAAKEQLSLMEASFKDTPLQSLVEAKAVEILTNEAYKSSLDLPPTPRSRLNTTQVTSRKE
jgi:hypothetical protein